jgi:methyl-accepting chemotaxis protein
VTGNWKRRNYFIKPDIQGLFMLKMFLLVVFCCVLYAAILAAFSTDTVTITYRGNNLVLGKTSVMLFKEMMKAQGLFILSGGIGAALFALLLSHSFAGPIFKLERCFTLMQGGNHSFTVMFRPNDKGHELAKAMNSYNRKISQDIAEMRDITNALLEQLARIENPSGDSDSSGAEEVAHLVSRLQNKLNSYTIHS